MKDKKILNLPFELADKQPIVFYDGECALCSKSVLFLLKHNHSGNLNFASLNSDAGTRITGLGTTMLEQADTLLLLQDNQLFGFSTAALKITEHLGFPMNLLRYLVIIPAFIRDLIYKIVVKKRYTWFGKEPFCMTNAAGYQNRFIGR